MVFRKKNGYNNMGSITELCMLGKNIEDFLNNIIEGTQKPVALKKYELYCTDENLPNYFNLGVKLIYCCRMTDYIAFMVLSY